MAVLAKMVVASKTENYGGHFPPEHFDEDHYGNHFLRDAEGKTSGLKDCDCKIIEGGVGGVQVIMRPVYSTEVGHENQRMESGYRANLFQVRSAIHPRSDPFPESGLPAPAIHLGVAYLRRLAFMPILDAA